MVVNAPHQNTLLKASYTIFNLTHDFLNSRSLINNIWFEFSRIKFYFNLPFVKLFTFYNNINDQTSCLWVTADRLQVVCSLFGYSMVLGDGRAVIISLVIVTFSHFIFDILLQFSTKSKVSRYSNIVKLSFTTINWPHLSLFVLFIQHVAHLFILLLRWWINVASQEPGNWMLKR